MQTQADSPGGDGAPTAPPLEYETVARAVDDLRRRGFTEGLRVIDGGLRTIGSGEAVRAEDLVIREVHRVEGVSDPDDMAIVYGIEGRRGRNTMARHRARHGEHRERLVRGRRYWCGRGRHPG